MKNLLLALFAALLGVAGGIAYSWGIAPVKYVDASPALLRADFKDQYRIVIAASYASSHDLARARARLQLLSADPLGDVKAQAQRMVGSSEYAASVDLLVQLAADLEKGVAEIPPTNIPTPISPRAFETDLPPTFTPIPTYTATPELIFTLDAVEVAASTAQPEVTITPRATLTALPNFRAAFILVGQDEVCDPGIQPGLLQFKLLNARRAQTPGVEIIVTSVDGEDRFYTGFKPELGDGYADFVMKENTSYSVRIGEGGTFIANLSAPICTDPNGVASLGGLALSFQQP